MYKPARDDLLIYQGSTFDKRWAWEEDGVPVDLTSASIRAQIRPSPWAPKLFADMTMENGRAVIHDPVNGIFGIRLSAEETAKLNFCFAMYDLEVQWADGQVNRVLYGNVTLDPEVTR